jgi:phage N-6-adenine-methyltransferase
LTLFFSVFVTIYMGRNRIYRSNAAKQRAYRRRHGQPLRRRHKPKYVPVYHRHQSVEWSTPSDFFAKMDAEFHFTLDAAATSENAKCPKFFTREQDGLKQAWGQESVWLDPPYGRVLRHWIGKAHHSAQQGATAVCLVPARTGTSWWHEVVIPHAAEIRLLRGRLKFGGANNSAPFDSAIVVFRPKTSRHGAITGTQRECLGVGIPPK